MIDKPLSELLAPLSHYSPTVKGTDLHQVRRWNRLLVLNCLREHAGASRATVAELTGLSRPTVTTIVEALLRDGLLTEGAAPPAQGRRGRMIPLRFNAQAGAIVGVDMGRDHLTVVISDLAAHIIAQEHYAFAMSDGPARCLAALDQYIHDLVRATGIRWETILGIGIGMPGPLDATLRFPVRPPGMPTWDGVPLRDHLQAALCVPVYLDNNANMGALGENRYGSARQVANLVYVRLDSGIGCGFILDKRLYRGGSGSAGEIGHIPIEPHGVTCVCGNRGCLETIASIGAIVANARQASRKRATFEAVIEEAKQGDAPCRMALERAGTAIGAALATIVNTYNPTMIVLDGRTTAAGDLIMVPAREALAAQSLGNPLAHARVALGALTSRAVSLGAVATVLDSVFIGAAAPA